MDLSCFSAEYFAEVLPRITSTCEFVRFLFRIYNPKVGGSIPPPATNPFHT